MTNQQPTQEQCDHKHFSPICNSCDTNMIVEAERRGRIDMAGDMREKIKENSLIKYECETDGCLNCFRAYELLDELDELKDTFLALQHEEGKE